jgi:hypothetical protein
MAKCSPLFFFGKPQKLFFEMAKMFSTFREPPKTFFRNGKNVLHFSRTPKNFFRNGKNVLHFFEKLAKKKPPPKNPQKIFFAPPVRGREAIIFLYDNPRKTAHKSAINCPKEANK